MSTFANNLKQQEKELNIGGNKYKFQEGDNKFRLVSAAIPHKSMYKGRESLKFVCYIIDRKDGKVKTAFMPYTVIKAIGELAINEEYAFDILPPYDVNVKAKGAGTKEVEYTIIPGRTNSELSEREDEMIKKLPPIEKVVEKLKEKQPELSQGRTDDEEAPAFDDSQVPF